MDKTADLELVPNEKHVAKPVFKDRSEYEAFSRSFYEKVRPWLEEMAKARQQSEEEAMRRWRR